MPRDVVRMPVGGRHPLSEQERKELARDLESLAKDPPFVW